MQAFKRPVRFRRSSARATLGGCQTYMNAAFAEFKNRERTRATT